MREKIIAMAVSAGADLVGFAPASRFNADDAIFKIFPDTKTVIGLGFRVLRGIYRGTEEGTTFYQYTTMAVENMEETIMPMAPLRTHKKPYPNHLHNKNHLFLIFYLYSYPGRLHSIINPNLSAITIALYPNHYKMLEDIV